MSSVVRPSSGGKKVQSLIRINSQILHESIVRSMPGNPADLLRCVSLFVEGNCGAVTGARVKWHTFNPQVFAGLCPPTPEVRLAPFLTGGGIAVPVVNVAEHVSGRVAVVFLQLVQRVQIFREQIDEFWDALFRVRDVNLPGVPVDVTFPDSHNF